ncbi:8413_t:CDS:1, partial [Funneliformis caledonium]
RNAMLPIDNPDDSNDFCTNQNFTIQERIDHLINKLPWCD